MIYYTRMDNITFKSGLLTVVYGLYFYVLHQLVYLIRFGSLNTNFNLLDLLLIVVGILSVLLYVYFAKESDTKRKVALRVAFVLAIPFASIGSLMGGLLGALGILIYGLIPFVVFLLVAHLLFRRTSEAKV